MNQICKSKVIGIWFTAFMEIMVFPEHTIQSFPRVLCVKKEKDATGQKQQTSMLVFIFRIDGLCVKRKGASERWEPEQISQCTPR